jgi:hypothetical protein
MIIYVAHDDNHDIIGVFDRAHLKKFLKPYFKRAQIIFEHSDKKGKVIKTTRGWQLAYMGKITSITAYSLNNPQRCGYQHDLDSIMGFRKIKKFGKDYKYNEAVRQRMNRHAREQRKREFKHAG